MIIVNAWAIGIDPNIGLTQRDSLIAQLTTNGANLSTFHLEFAEICPGITFGLANVELTLAFLL